MKQIFWLLIAIVGVSALVLQASCKDAQAQQAQIENCRIKCKLDENIKGVNYQILEIDGVEYLCNYHGGIIQLPKKD